MKRDAAPNEYFKISFRRETQTCLPIEMSLSVLSAIVTCFLSMKGAERWKEDILVFLLSCSWKRLLVEWRPTVSSSCLYRPRYKQEHTMRGPPLHPLNSPPALPPSSNLPFYPSLCASESLMCLFGTSSISDNGLPSKWSLFRLVHTGLCVWTFLSSIPVSRRRSVTGCTATLHLTI